MKKQNCKKPAVIRNYSFAANNHINRHCVKVVNYYTNEETFYNSMYAVQQHLGINAGIISMCCNNKNYVKSGISKINNNRYKFSFISEDELPENYIKSTYKHKKREIVIID